MAEARLVRFAALDPTSLRQRAKVIVEDFRDEIAGRLGGRAKAMVVCTGRRHAWEMCQALREWDHTLPDCGFGVLVAFSGSLPDVQEVTESQVNGFPESQLPDRFGYVKADDPAAAERGQDEYRILVVADKYQTGFDQPLLCGMYVDKRLTGVAAVQTLSRLNRVHPLKTQDDVRVLDFVNTASDIQDAFRPWFETTITGHADRATKLAEEADGIRALVAAGDYRQAEERLTRLATEDPQQAEPLLLELGFITLPDPDRRLVATAWSAIAVGRTVQSLLAGDDDISPPDGLPETASAATPLVTEAAAPVQPQTPRRSPQQSGAALEQATVDLFARFFAVEPDAILGRLRRQGGGVQFGHDIESEWTVAGSPAVRCHVECKNLDRRVTVDDIAGKLAQQKYHHRGIQVDHWILISPHHDVANDLPGMLETWDQQDEYPFSVQIWSPETRVREMFALEPAVYEAVYGRPPTQEEVSASGEVAELIRQRLAPQVAG